MYILRACSKSTHGCFVTHCWRPVKESDRARSNRRERERVENIQHSLTLFEFATVVRLRREKRCRLCWERFRRDCRPRAAKLLSGEMALSNLPTRSSSSSSSITPSCSRPLDISSTASCKERRMLPTHPDTCVCASDSLLPKNCIFFHPTDKVCWESQWYLEENDLFFGKKSQIWGLEGVTADMHWHLCRHLDLWSKLDQTLRQCHHRKHFRLSINPWCCSSMFFRNTHLTSISFNPVKSSCLDHKSENAIFWHPDIKV